MTVFAWTAAAFLSGSIPFAVLIGHFVLKTDIRAYGDHNPGATNVGRAGGWRWGVVAALADFFKAALPVSLAWLVGSLDGDALIAVALAPVAGHAFSPWLGFRGGKAVAATFGIWAGLTWFYLPPFMGLLLALGFMLFTVDAWAVMFMLAGVMLHVGAIAPDPVLFAVALGNMAIVGWKHRHSLAALPALKPQVLRFARRQQS